MSFRFLRTRRVLLLAACPAVAGLLQPQTTSAASSGAGSLNPFESLFKIEQIKPNPFASPPAEIKPLSDGTVTSYPFQSPPINGFQPFVVYGLTNEQDHNSFYSPQSDSPGGTTVPNPAKYFVATLDSGSQSHILSYADAQAINLDASGLGGTYTIEATGAGGSGASETLDISDALGAYATGLANATPGANGPLVSPSNLRGTSNTSILTAEEGSLIPSLIGQPQFAYYRATILNSQTQRLTVSGQTYQGPQVTFQPFASAPPLPSSYVQTALTVTSYGGTNDPAAFFPNFSDTNLANDPTAPTFWNGMYLNVNLPATGNNPKVQTFLLDTGAQVSVLSSSVANSLGIKTGGSNPTPPDFYVDVLGVGGVTQVPGFIISSLTINTSGGDQTWTDVPILVQNVQDPRTNGVGFLPGILGMNLFTDRDLIINGDLNDPYFAFSENAFVPHWTGTTGGNWGDNSKWLGGVPSATGAPANFTSDTPAPQTINVDADYTFTSLSFDNPGSYTLSGSGRLTIEAEIGAAAINVVSGSHTISAPMTLASSTAINVAPPQSTLTISNDVSADSAIITKLGAGTLAMKNIRSAGLNVNAGTLSLLPNGGSSGVSHVGSLAIASGARLDLTNNKLIVSSPGQTGTWNGSQYTGISGMVQSARGTAGDWSGTTGITSSTAANDPNKKLYALGVAKASDILAGIGDTGTGTFAGQTVTGSDTLVMFTYGGDANLDGKINIDDYGLIDSHVGQSGSAFGWHNGDFNYDGKINIDDYGIIDANIGAQGPPISTSGQSLALMDGASGISMVPEPGAIASVLGFLSLGMASRRRRGIR
jgi:hypothetical protein